MINEVIIPSNNALYPTIAWSWLFEAALKEGGRELREQDIVYLTEVRNEMEVYSFANVGGKHRDVSLVLCGNDQVPDLFTSRQQHFFLYSTGSQNFTMEGQFTGQRNALSNFGL